ncbi:MAG: hypothetical protein ACRDVF_06920, partial [Microbacterium sp.]|uniref:hypothetical protein n=1 Tax=Microbacterium sp. TaxID=51671 RepID=UPI003D6E28C2
RAEPLSSIAQWANAATTLAPLGWRPAIEPGLQVPTYAVGLPLLMAPLNAAGGAVGTSLVIAFCFFIVVLATAALALRLSGPFAALIAAVGIASSPVALIEAMQPMSDVPVTAAWLVCWILIVPWGRAGHVRLILGGLVAAPASCSRFWSPSSPSFSSALRSTTSLRPSSARRRRPMWSMI